MQLADEFDTPPEFAQDGDNDDEDTMSDPDGDDTERVAVIDSVPVKERAGGETVTLKEN
jgi:hypothetical protein